MSNNEWYLNALEEKRRKEHTAFVIKRIASLTFWVCALIALIVIAVKM